MSGPLRVRARAAGMAAALALLLGALAAPPRAAAEPMAVIVHPDTPVENMTLAEVRRVFLGERQYWNAETPVVLIVRAPVAPERTVVLDRIYRMSESQFKQYWIARIFRAEATSTPKVVYSNQTINELVSAIPGAISLVRAEAILPGTKVKRIKIDGLLPGEANYPLR
jgi:ABC-type phosphate transport system substrate-binding protein